MKNLFFLLLLFFASVAYAQQFTWVKAGIDCNFAPNIAGGTNLVASTGYKQPLPGQLTSPYYLAVHDTLGNLAWSKNLVYQALGGINNNIPAVAVDNSQHVIIAGSYRNSLFIDAPIFTASGQNGSTMYLVKFNAAGVLQWARNSTFAASQQITSVNTATDGAGNIYVTGCFAGTLTVGTMAVTAFGSRDAFIAKYDTNGNLLWLKNAGTINDESLVRSKVAPNGVIYLALTNTAFSPTPPLLLTKLDASGTVVWTRTMAPGGKTLPSLAIDNANNVYLVGSYSGSIDFTSTSSLTSIINYKVFLAKFNSNGVFKWAKDLATGNNYTSGTPAIYYSADNNLGITGFFNGTATFGNVPFSSAPSGSNNTFVIKTDTAGALLWTTIVPSSAGDNRSSGITGNNQGNYFIAGNLNGSATFSGATQNAPVSKLYVAKLNEAGGNLVSGMFFLDSNANGQKDAAEKELPFEYIGTTGAPFANMSALDGSYNLLLPAGNHVLIPAAKRNYNFVPASHNVSFTGNNQAVLNKDFAVQLIPNQTDVKVVFTNLTAARPGFHFSSHLSIQNQGTTILSDTLTLQFDPALINYVNSSVTPVTVQNGKLKWFYANLQPLESRSIRINFIVAPTTPLNSVLQASAIIKPLTADLFQADNYDTTRILVTGSYDPNDKQVNKQAISPMAVARGEFLDYTIRFQNTGTDTAFTVLVTDKLSQNLQLNTFEMLAASHPYILSLSNNNTLEWRFNNVLLPDSNRNEPASHGFVRFRMKPKTTLALGDSVKNKAAIYFDFNTPVITNTAVTKIANPTGIKDQKTELQAFKLYPNPAKSYVMVEAAFRKNVPSTVTLTNMLGQTISRVQLPANNQIHYQMPLKDLPKGVYVIQLETEAGRQTQRLVVQ